MQLCFFSRTDPQGMAISTVQLLLFSIMLVLLQYNGQVMAVGTASLSFLFHSGVFSVQWSRHGFKDSIFFPFPQLYVFSIMVRGWLCVLKVH